VKMAVFWIVAPCSLVEVYQRFRGPCCLHHQGSDDRGSKDIWNVGKLLPDYTVLQPRRQLSILKQFVHLHNCLQAFSKCMKIVEIFHSILVQL
jgi:hypothetical protein